MACSGSDRTVNFISCCANKQNFGFKHVIKEQVFFFPILKCLLSSIVFQHWPLKTKKIGFLESLSSYKLGWQGFQVRQNCCSYSIFHYPWNYLYPLSLGAALRLSETFVYAWSLSTHCPCFVCSCIQVCVHVLCLYICLQDTPLQVARVNNTVHFTV